MKKTKKIFFVTVGRSDYLRQLPIINYLKNKNNIYLKILITGSHSYKLYGETINHIKKNNVSWENCCPKKYSLKTKDISLNLNECLARIDKTIKKDCPDILVLFGDRYEVLAGALAAFGKKILIILIVKYQKKVLYRVNGKMPFLKDVLNLHLLIHHHCVVLN